MIYRPSCVVSGSFDPLTNGHLYLVNEALNFFGKVYVVIAANPAKKGLLDFDERKALCHEVFDASSYDSRVDVSVLAQGYMLIEHAQALGATAIIRGLRNATDFEYEHSVDLVQRKISSIRTMYFITPREYTEVSSSLIRSIYGLQGWDRVIKDYVPPAVLTALLRKEGR